jgi:Trypsin-like peptidase domain
MIISRYLSPDRSLALEISQPPGAWLVEVVSRADGRRQTLPSSLVPRSPVHFSETNDIIILHEGTSSMGCWPVAFRRSENGAYERWETDAGESLFTQLTAQLPDTISVARMWICALGFVPSQRIEAEAAITGAGPAQRIQGRFRFVYDIATAKIGTIFVSPEIAEIRDYWDAPTSTGSGFFISRDGLVLTAKHVVADAQAIFVQDFDGRRYRAEVIKKGYYDVALLKVDAKAPSIIPISPEAELKIGEKLLTMGFPVNVAHPGFYWDQIEFSEGSLSALRPQDRAGENFQFTAPIRPGNSGGAIIFENGSLAGIAVAGYDAVKAYLNTGVTALLINVGLKFQFALLTLPPFWLQESQPSITSRDDAIRNLARASVCLACYKQ